jgi:predicted MFS family arabinose efflux permease
MSVQSLGKGLTEQVFHVDDTGLGLLIASIGVSAVITAIATALMGERFRSSILIRIGLVIYGLGLWVVSATDVFAIGLVGFAITGFAHVLVNVSVTTAIQAHVPNVFRGRVTSLQLMGIILSMAAGAQLGGALGDAQGLPLVVALYGSVLIAFAAFAHLRLDGLRALD